MSVAVIPLETETPYFEHIIDLTVARNNKEFPVKIPGGADFVFVKSINGSLSFKPGVQTADALDLATVRAYDFRPGKFKVYYLTNTAQAAGKSATLLIGGAASFSVEAWVSKIGVTDTAGADVNPAEERVLTPAIEATGDLTGAAYSGTTSIADRFRLENVTIHLSAAVDPTITITLDSVKGAAYDTVLAKRSAGGGNIQDWVAAFGSGYEYDTNDEIKVDITAVAATHGTIVRVSKGGKT